MSETSTYLVPFDFTPIAEIALDHALGIAKTDGGKIVLLNVVGSDKEIAGSKVKLDVVAKKAGANVSTHVIKGDIFKDINTVAGLVNSELIIMGTHGMKGMQKVFGSFALKVISSSGTPFLVTQSKGFSGYKNILMPFNFEKESIQVCRFVRSLAQKFDATIHLVAYREKDSSLKTKVLNNQKLAHDYLMKHNVKHVGVTLPANSGKSYEAELLNYAKECNADLLSAAYFPHTPIPQFDTFVQHMITNEHNIPVLTVNAHEVMSIRMNYSFLSI